MLVAVSLHLTLLAVCFALPPGRKVTSVQSLPEGEPKYVPWGPGGLADMPEIVDETNLANANEQTTTNPTAADNTLTQMNEIWDHFVDPEFNPHPSPDTSPELPQFNPPINILIANMLAGVNPPAIMNAPAFANQNQIQQQPQVLIDEDDEENADEIPESSIVADLVEIDFSEDPDSTGLGNVEDIYSDGSQPFANHPMVKRDTGNQQSGLDIQTTYQISEQEDLKQEQGDFKIITPAQWEFWYEALNETAFAPLYDGIHAATDLGLDLEQASYQAARVSKGAANPNAFLKEVFYPMFDEIKNLALIPDGEDMAKELLHYQEPVKGMVEVNNITIQTFLENYAASRLAFSSAATNIGPTASRIRFSTTNEAKAFESWATDPKNRPYNLVQLIIDLSQAVDAVFSALSTLQANYGFLGAEFEDIDFDELYSEVDEEIVVQGSPVVASVRYDSSSPLDPNGDMFKSRELPRVLPPSRQGIYSAA
ncbi:hypothetical protein TWF730_011164 [Orbilia blumenaviensis]|uniref:Uncharacterized protein n=1 Tax=Orbilia blumenaviensis TaxID=1796055 RepID=A0AAV9UN81_9PEZI